MNNEIKDWQDLTKLTQGAPIVLERVSLPDKGIVIEGQFELPPLARLTSEDQIFVATFIRTHGSIKEMEHLFGVSYPTIKNRLNKISEQLGFLDVTPTPAPSSTDILDQLKRGEITAAEALERIKK